MKEQFTLFRSTHPALKKSFTLLGNAMLSWLVSTKKQLGNTILSWITTTKWLLNLFRKKILSLLITLKKYFTKLMHNLSHSWKSWLTSMKKLFTKLSGIPALLGNKTLSWFTTLKKPFALFGSMILSWFATTKTHATRLADLPAFLGNTMQSGFVTLNGRLSLFGSRIKSSRPQFTNIKRGLTLFGNMVLSWFTTLKKHFALFWNTTLSWLVTVKRHSTKLIDHLFLFGKSSSASVKRTLTLFGNTTLSLLVSTKKYLTLFGNEVLSWLTSMKKILTLFVSMILSGFATTKTHATRLAGLPAFLGNTMQSGFITLNDHLSLFGSRIKSSRPQFINIKKYFIDILPAILLLLVTLLALFISINGLLTDVGTPGRIFQILFLPITIYLVICSIRYVVSGSPAFGAPSGWSRVLRYYCLLISLAVVVAGFLSATTPSEYIISIIFSSLVVYFLISVWPGIDFEFSLSHIPKGEVDTYKVKFTAAKGNEKIDADRRDFLKLVGTAGISMFLYNLLFRRDSAPLFGNSTPNTSSPLALKNALGKVIDPAEKSPTQGYYISQIDESDISYFSFINKSGQWYIMRQDTDNSYRYTRGDKDAVTNWAQRSKLPYDYFDNVF